MATLKVDNSTISLQLKINSNGSEWSKYISDNTKLLSSKIKIPGFRPGKAPANVLNKYLDKSEIYNKSLNNVLKKEIINFWKDKGNDKYKENIIDISTPNINVSNISDTSCDLVVTYDYVPTVTLPPIKQLSVASGEKIEVSNDDIEREINRLVEKDVMLEPKEDGKLENGENANINFLGRLDGKEFAGGKGDNYDLVIGSNSFIPGFESQLIGMKIGQKKTIKVSFPKDYGAKEMAGKDAEFDVTLNSISKINRPKLDKDYIKKLNIDGVENEDQLKKYLQTLVKEEKEQMQLEKAKNEISKKISDTCKISHYPQSLIEEEKNRIYDQLNRQLQYSHMTLDDYLKNVLKKTKEEYDGEIVGQAKKNILLSVAINKIIDQLKLEATQKEIDDYINKFAKVYHMSGEELKKQMGNNIALVKTMVLQQKVFKELSK